VNLAPLDKFNIGDIIWHSIWEGIKNAIVLKYLNRVPFPAAQEALKLNRKLGKDYDVAYATIE